MEWSIQQIARSRRHHEPHAAALRRRRAARPPPAAHNGYRHYDQASLVRLQRILLLRELGLGLPAIAEVLDRETEAGRPWPATSRGCGRSRTGWRGRSRRSKTIEALKVGGEIMAENMFDGFDHTQYKDEVEQRWGKDAYARQRRLVAWDERRTRRRRGSSGAAPRRDWIAAAESGIAPDSAEAQALAKRHVEWLTGIPGTPARRRPGAVATSRGTSSGSARCMSPIRGSARTTAATPVPSSSATRCASTPRSISRAGARAPGRRGPTCAGTKLVR